MIVRVQTGKSFKGAGLYYLHDKREKGDTRPLLSADRVAWTYTLNLSENDPEQALSEMRKTAFDAPMLRMMSGNRVDGRPVKHEVMTVALSWSKEEGIDPATPAGRMQMIEGARNYLKHMGWSDLQSMIVCHNDTDHPHAHLIVNRIHPDTGMAQDKAWVKHRSSEWALAYERERGAVLCEARIGKYERGERAPDGHMTREQHATWQQQARQPFGSERDHAATLKSGEWRTLKDTQKADRLAFVKETATLKRELRGEVARQVAAEFAPQWAEYATYKAERERAAKQFDAETRRAVKYLRRHHSVQGVADLRKKQQDYHAALREDLYAHRRPIHEAQSACLAAVAKQELQQLDKERAAAYEALKATHREEKQDLRRDQPAEIPRAAPQVTATSPQAWHGQATAKSEPPRDARPEPAASVPRDAQPGGGEQPKGDERAQRWIAALKKEREANQARERDGDQTRDR